MTLQCARFAPSMRKVVFDTNIFVRSLINPYGIWGRLIFEHADAYQLVISKPIAREILEVLRRPELTGKFRSVATRDFGVIVDLLSLAQTVDLPEVPAVARDPKDDPFLATARAAAADYLVSEDQDLLVLGEYEGTKIVTAAAFLALLEQESP